MSRRVLIAGASGMLGHDLITRAENRDVEFTALARVDLDVTNLAAVREAVVGHDVVINAAAYTAVDAAESDEAAAFAVNAIGARNIAIATAEIGASLLHVSTDYVFAGDAKDPYTINEPLDPRSAYGRTKAAGELFVRVHNPERGYIVRTAWLYGEHGASFPRTMLRLAAEGKPISVVNDQTGQPTWTRDLADRLWELALAEPFAGVLHATNAGETTWYELARAVLDLHGYDPEQVSPTTSESFVRPAPRPAYSVLDHRAWSRVNLPPLRDWREALTDATTSGVFGVK